MPRLVRFMPALIVTAALAIVGIDHLQTESGNLKKTVLAIVTDRPSVDVQTESYWVIDTTDSVNDDTITVVVRVPSDHLLESPSAGDCKIVSIDDVDAELSKLVEECIGFGDSVPSRREFYAQRRYDGENEGWLFWLNGTERGS